MRLRKLGSAILVVLAVGAVIGSNASAAVTTGAAEWYTGASPGTTLTGDQAITASIGTHPGIGAKFRLISVIGIDIELTATGVECIGCQITNSAVTEKIPAVAIGKGKLKFTGVTADAPTGCTVRNENSSGQVGVVETKPLTVHADWMEESKAFQQWFPQSGTVFATFYVEGGGCAAITGSYNLKGTLFSEAKNATGVQAAVQEVVFSPAIQTTTGAELKIGTQRADLTGTIAFSIGGTAFGIH